MTQRTDAAGMRILVPLDGSETAEQILNQVAPLAAKLEAEIVLLQAVPGLSDTLAGSHIALDIARAAIEEDKKKAAEYLEGVAASLRPQGLNVSVLVGEGPAAASILHHLKDVSLVAMSTHGRSGVRRTLFGSVADEVVRHSHLPVLVFRPS